MNTTGPTPSCRQHLRLYLEFWEIFSLFAFSALHLNQIIGLLRDQLKPDRPFLAENLRDAAKVLFSAKANDGIGNGGFNCKRDVY